MPETMPDSSAEKAPFEGILPGTPAPFFLSEGEGEKSIVFDTLFTILLSGDETEGQYGAFTNIGPKGDRIPAHNHPDAHEIFFIMDGAVTLWMDDREDYHEKRTLETGGFAFVPKGMVHAYRMETQSKIFGISTGGFERFFHGIGTPTETYGIPERPFIPPFPQMLAAGQKYGTVFMPDFQFRD